MHYPSAAPGEELAGAGDDATLVEAARHDLAAFAGLYRRYVTPVYRYLYSRVGNATDAEDLTSQVFAEALEGLPGYHERGRFAAWLFRIARRRAADHFRRRRLTLPLNEETERKEADPLAQLVQEEALGRLAALVAGLGEEEQELLRLRFAAGLSYKEVAAILGRSEPAVKMAVHRLLHRLEAVWEERND